MSRTPRGLVARLSSDMASSRRLVALFGRARPSQLADAFSAFAGLGQLEIRAVSSITAGPAVRTDGGTPSAYAAKFCANIRASLCAWASYAALSCQVARGSRTSDGTPGTDAGTSTLKIGSVRVGTPSSRPLRAARTIRRVWSMFIRSPVPYGPPVQPVLTSQTGTSHLASRSISMAAYSPGWRGMNGAPKQAENVAFGSWIPISVPASFAV